VVAHQSSTIRNAAGIAVVKDGMTVEQGKHDELMINEGRGHTLCTLDAQFCREDDKMETAQFT
jgi:subfamily B ATP-binding cassette protein MsbA